MKSNRHSGQMGVQDREGPSVGQLGKGEGPYGSWNEDLGRGDLEVDDGWFHVKGHSNLKVRQGAEDLFESIFNSEVREEIRRYVLPRINSHVNRALMQSIRKGYNQSYFSCAVTKVAREVVEDAYHTAALELGLMEPDSYSPRGLTKLMDHLLRGTEDLIQDIAERLKLGYASYLSASSTEGA